MLANLEELADVRVADGRRRPGLAHAADRASADRTTGRMVLIATERWSTLVDRFVDDAHAAAAEQADDAVVPDAIGRGL